MSPKTLEAYRRDVPQFLGFLADHLAGAPSLKQLAKLTPQDVRAFMAARRRKRHRRSLADARAGRRALVRALSGTQRQGQGRRAHCRARAESAEDPAEAAGGVCRQANHRHRAARGREHASHGYSRATPRCWRCSTAPACASPKRSASSAKTVARQGDALTVTGKGNKAAWCRCCRRCAKSIADYVALCPYDLPATARCSSAPRGARCRPASCS